MVGGSTGHGNSLRRKHAGAIVQGSRAKRRVSRRPSILYRSRPERPLGSDNLRVMPAPGFWPRIQRGAGKFDRRGDEWRIWGTQACRWCRDCHHFRCGHFWRDQADRTLRRICRPLHGGRLSRRCSIRSDRQHRGCARGIHAYH